VVAATGAFTPPGVDGGPGLRLVRSKGTHLLADLSLMGIGDRALVLPETDDGRVLYIVPWLGHAMVGTTDTPYTDDPARPAASDDDVDYLIRHVRRYLDVPPFEPVSTFAGLRALADTGGGSTARASREHVVGEPVPGYVQVAGGKLTTYRRIAAEAADRVAAFLRLDRRSATGEIPLVGTGGARPELERRLQAVGLPATAVGPTIARYGTESETIAGLVETDPRLAAPLGDGRTTLADVVHAVRHEAAASIGDVTLRRTHLAWFSKDHARSDAPAVASVMGDELGWDAAETARRLSEHEEELAAEGL
jgi:glycerol-3-phosphate dehydrogenase